MNSKKEQQNADVRLLRSIMEFCKENGLESKESQKMQVLCEELGLFESLEKVVARELVESKYGKVRSK